jgi:hypothetical protein
MAISANAVWNLRSSATGTVGKNGGFFVTGASGTNYSLQDGAQYALNGVTSGGAGNTITVASASSDMIGNGIFVVSGTNFTLNSWFEITNVVGTVVTCSTNAAGASISTGIGSSGVMNIGGANTLPSALADDMFEAGAAGNTYYIKSGSYTVGESISLVRDGTTSLPIKIKGYTSTQGDSCTGDSRPILSFGSFSLTLGSYYWCHNLSINSSSVTTLTMGASNKIVNCKVINKSSTGTNGINTSTNFFIHSCEAACLGLGTAINLSTNSGTVANCYIHSSANGIVAALTSGHQSIFNNLIIDCLYGVAVSALTSGVVFIANNTFCTPISSTSGFSVSYGIYATSALPTGIILTNNIFSQLVTGVYTANNPQMSFELYNDYYDNDTDVSTWVKDSTATAVNPTFANVGFVSGTTATTTSGNHLVQSGATFISSGVVAGRDYLYLRAGTGVTAMFYPILSVDSETQITTDATLTANATADKVWGITTGRNFAVGLPMKALGGPQTKALGQTTSYFEQGAAQRREKGTTVSTFIG